jgi:hypothetical protein
MTVVEKRSPVGSPYERHNLVFAWNGGNGVPDRYRFNERRPDHWMSQSHGNSGDRGSRDSIHRTRNGNATASTGLPNWYPYAAIIATIAAAIAILIITGML